MDLSRDKHDYPKVSIVLTTLNDLKNLKRCLLTILNQDYPLDKYDIIVVDAGSSDGSLEFLKNLQATSPVKIKLIIENGCTRSKGRNIGILSSDSELIAIVNSDAALAPDWLRIVTSFLNNHSEAAGVGSYQICPTDQGLTGKAIWHIPSMVVNEYSHPALKDKEFCESIVLPNEAALYRRNALISIGLFDERINIGEDSEMNAHLIEQGWKLYVCKLAKIEHYYKCTFLRFIKQQFQYGYGAAILEKYIPLQRLIKWIPYYKLLGGKLSFWALISLLILSLTRVVPVHIMGTTLAGAIILSLGALTVLGTRHLLSDARNHDPRLLFFVWLFYLVKTMSNVAGYWYGLLARSFKPKISVGRR